MRKNKKIGLLLALVLVAGLVYGGFKLTEPSYSLTMDVNPSIEIVSNRLDQVVEVNPLNEDAREMLKDFQIKDKDLTKTIEDLADLMVLTGYISGGEDNLVMITVSDGSAGEEALNKLNTAIAAYLENKQIEATIVNQAIPQYDESNQTGKELIARKIEDLDDELDYQTLANMSLRELVTFAESKNIDPEALFTSLVQTKSSANIDTTDSNDTNTKATELIGNEKAKEIALEKTGGGKVVDFELDWDDGTPEYEIEIKDNGYEYELEIDGYTGQILDFDKDEDDDYKKSVSKAESKKEASTKPSLIGDAKVKEISLGKTGGGTIVEYDLDWDDGVPEYEIEIDKNGLEYTLEIHGYTGEILEFEIDD